MAKFLLNLPRYPNIFNTRSAAWMLALQYSRFSSVAPMARSRQLRTKRKPPHMRIWAKRIFRWKSCRVSPAAKRHHWGFGWIPISNYLKPTVDGRKSAPPVWNHANNGIYQLVQDFFHQQYLVRVPCKSGQFRSKWTCILILCATFA